MPPTTVSMRLDFLGSGFSGIVFRADKGKNRFK